MKRIIISFCLLLLSCVALNAQERDMYPVKNARELIIGDWGGVMPEGVQWTFSADSVTSSGYEGFNAYEIVMQATESQCPGSSYINVYDEDQLVLIWYSNTGRSTCYMIDHISDSDLVLFYEPRGEYLSFDRKGDE